MFEIYGFTHVGMLREHNEDAFLVPAFVGSTGSHRIAEIEGNLLLAVADGVGGLAAGEIASSLALKELSQIDPTLDSDALKEAIQVIDQKISDYGSTHPESKGLGCTLTGITVVENKVRTFNVGDSRVYRYRDGILRQYTHDQSLVQSLFDAGEISREECFTHPQKNMILQSLGGVRQKGIVLEGVIEELRGSFEPGDLFLLCSDGLSDLVSDDAMETILEQASSLSQAINFLVKQANDNGGTDNITAVGIQCH